jgi:hypothetical protein
MTIIHIIISIISIFYLLLWINELFIKPEKGIYKTLVNIFKYVLLIPFWALIALNTINLFLPVELSGGFQEKKVVIDNNTKLTADVYFLGKLPGDEEWYVIHPIKEAKIKSTIELVPGRIYDSITVDLPFDTLFTGIQGKTSNKSEITGQLSSINDTVKVNNKNVIIINKANINSEFEFTQVILYLLVVFGLWYHVVSTKEKESRGKFVAGSVVASLLCLYIIYHYLFVILILK